MQVADHLYGVTQQERGVSKRVSVRFENVKSDGSFVASNQTTPTAGENASRTTAAHAETGDRTETKADSKPNPKPDTGPDAGSTETRNAGGAPKPSGALRRALVTMREQESREPVEVEDR